jgi:hypothetical protein
MIANMAFAVGLMTGLEAELPRLLPGLTFGHARRNFYEAARLGMQARLVWPDEHGIPREVPALDLFDRLLPVAKSGLLAVGVTEGETAHWLEVVERRALCKVSGASWQKAAFRRLLTENDDRTWATHALLERYQELSTGGAPVAEWPEK